MTLARALEDSFRGDIRFRGASLFKTERVTITRVSPESVLALVQDGVEYSTQIGRNEGAAQLSCTCAQPGKPAVNCKHLWATILTIDAGGLLTGTVRPGFIPPFATEAETGPASDDYWDGDSNRDVFVPPARTRVAREAEPVVPLRGWEAQLRGLGTGMAATADPAAAAPKEREVFYEVDISQSRDRKMLVLQTSQRQRRSNGQWGKRKPLKLRQGQIENLERDDDRRILAYLTGGVPERPTWFNQSEGQSSVFRYYLSFSLAEMLLPVLCQTGRLCLLEEDQDTLSILEWDEGPAWELCLNVANSTAAVASVEVIADEDDEDTEENDDLPEESDAEAEADAARDAAEDGLDEVAEAPAPVTKAEPVEPEWLVNASLRRGDEILSPQELTLAVPGGFLIARAKVSRLEDFGAFEWISLLKPDGAVKVPIDEGRDLVDRLLDMPQLPRLELPPDLRLEEVRTTPVPHLTLHTPRGVRWQHERLQGEISFAYDGARVRSSSPQGAIVQRDVGRCLLRDRPQEDNAMVGLEPMGFKRLLNPHRGPYDVEIPAKILGPAVRGLIKDGWQVHADGKQVHQAGAMKFEIKSGLDWFELHGRVDFEGRTVGFPELLSALARGDCTVRLDDGSLGILPEEWFKQFGLLSGLGVSEGDHVRFAQNQVGLLDALLMAQESVQVDAGFEQLRERLKSFTGINTTVEPEGFTGELRQYQREGFGWLRFLEDFRFGGCLADDMGLGKTVQLLALLQDRHNREDIHLPSLVVVPKSLIFNWKQESARFTPQMRVIEYIGLHRTRLRKKLAKCDIVLTTYGTIRRDILQLKDQAFDYVVLDEAQTIKNAGSQVAKAVRLLKAQHRLALSGTPIENRLGDLWSIFEFLNPGMLGRASVFRTQTSEGGDAESRTLLSHALRPFILRRTKREVARDLPEKLEQTVYCTMSKPQEALYNELRDHYRGSLLGIIQKQGLAKSKIHVLEALLRLRQAACHPGLLDPAKADDASAKMDVLSLQLQDLLAEGHKALVFSQFTSFLALVKRHLDEKKIPYEYLDGQTRDRRERIEHFQTDEKCGVFLISLKAGGLGLNLTAADYVFLLDPWWNPAVEMQAIDRAHRLGQTRQVFAYRLICRNTVEEKIAELQGRKKDLADAILQADNNVIQDLSAEDIELLLS